jgi:hypothetical protein
MRRMHRIVAAALLILALSAGSIQTARASWGVYIAVLPTPLHGDEPHAKVLAKTQIGAVCTVSVTYLGTHEHPTLFRPVTIKTKGVTTWQWHLQTKAHKLQATVSCKYGGVTLKSIGTITVVARR